MVLTPMGYVWCEAERLATEAMAAYRADIFARQYVYMVPGATGNQLVVAADAPPGGVLAINEMVPRNAEHYQICNWLVPALSRLPILPRE